MCSLVLPHCLGPEAAHCGGLIYRAERVRERSRFEGFRTNFLCSFKFDEYHDPPRVAILSSNSVRKSRSPSVSDFTSGSAALSVIAAVSAPGLFDVGESLVIAAMTASHASCASRRSRCSSGIARRARTAPVLAAYTNSTACFSVTLNRPASAI